MIAREGDTFSRFIQKWAGGRAAKQVDSASTILCLNRLTPPGSLLELLFIAPELFWGWPLLWDHSRALLSALKGLNHFYD